MRSAFDGADRGRMGKEEKSAQGGPQGNRYKKSIKIPASQRGKLRREVDGRRNRTGRLRKGRCKCKVVLGALSHKGARKKFEGGRKPSESRARFRRGSVQERIRNRAGNEKDKKVLPSIS